MNKIASLTLTALLLAPLAALLAAEPTLKPGDPAPKLSVSEWVQGKPITKFEKGKAYLVEFWATWCGPCVDSIPHLNEFHLKYMNRGLTVIGQNVDRNNQMKVKPFVAKMADKMTYPVALDYMEGGGLTEATWMTAAGQDGIPCVFLVGKDGRIAWIGYPSELTDKMIEKVLDDKFDVAKAAEKFLQKSWFDKAFEKFSKDIQEKKWADAVGLAETLAKTTLDKCLLKAMAEGLLENENLGGEELEAAYEMAVKANDGELAGGDEHRADHLLVLARATFMKGEKAKAIALQEQVLALLTGAKADETEKATARATLDSYKAGHLPATSPKKQEPAVTLKPGNPAPKLSSTEWIQGGPITEFAKDKAYLIEFWATWCGPCVGSIPYLNAFYLKFKDKGLVVIGQNVEGENQARVKAFVTKMADKMTYPVALDNLRDSPKGTMKDTWLTAAGQKGIPCAFLVGKDGRIAWIGNPSELTDKMIASLLDDKFTDEKAGMSREDQRNKAYSEFSEDIAQKNWDAAVRRARELSADESDSWRLIELASGLLENEGLGGEALATAYAIADKANRIMVLGHDNSRGKARHLQILARATFMLGEKEKAIALQKSAIDLIDDAVGTSNYKSALQATLDSYTAGHLPKTIIDEVQPDEKRWAMLRSGMSESEVLQLIGEPMQARLRPNPDSDAGTYVWQWGHIKYQSPCMPGKFGFSVLFTDGKLVSFDDPFLAIPSLDGVPTMPQPRFPLDGTTFTGDFCDLRWRPSSGKHPLRYDVETEVLDEFDGKWYPESRLSVDLPHATDSPHNVAYRWRVRATNPLGTSDWCEWQQITLRRRP